MTDLSGTTLLNRYDLRQKIGSGGMSDVYKVWDRQRAVSLAAKVLREDLAEDTVFLRRFQREADHLAQLQHPNIVRFYGLERDGAVAFILMDLIEGTTLRRRIVENKGPLTPEEILSVLRPVCAALYYAHQNELVHCDVKPANIMIDRSGKVLVTDFGIARMAEGATTTTMVGAGTPAYMAPEQVRGEDPIPQTDIYALGVVLYEMLTGGERPFTGEQATITGSTGEKVRWEQVNARPLPLRQFNPKISPDLEGVVAKCLEKDPHKRFTDTLGLLSAAEKALSLVSPQVPAPPVAPPMVEAARLSLAEESRPRMQITSTVDLGGLQPSDRGIIPVSIPLKPVPGRLSKKKVLAAVEAILWVGLVVVLIGIGVGFSIIKSFHVARQTTQTPDATLVAQMVATLIVDQISPTSAMPTLSPILIQSETPTVTATYKPTGTFKPPPPAATNNTATAAPTRMTPIISRVSPKDGMVQVYVPAGDFLMGSDPSKDNNAHNGELPQHTVYLDSYWIDKFEVSNDQYVKCEVAGACSRPYGTNSSTRVSYYVDNHFKNFPVINVMWNQAREYCIWVGRRLPSEAEWEKAARGTDGRIYPWGNNDPAENLLNYNKNVGDTTAVGSYPSGASPYGALDMAGNVAEWVNDLYSDNYYQQSPLKNPTGPTSGDLYSRMIRGGSWSDYGRQVRSASRELFYSVVQWWWSWDNGFWGFRCAASP
jgi:serine/threonine-protein kinase